MIKNKRKKFQSHVQEERTGQRVQEERTGKDGNLIRGD